jgi:hypothetical protein
MGILYEIHSITALRLGSFSVPSTYLLTHPLLFHIEGDGGDVLLDVAEGDRLLQLFSQARQLRSEQRREH